MKNILKIETPDPQLIFDIMEQNSFSRGSSIEAPGGVKLEFEDSYTSSNSFSVVNSNEPGKMIFLFDTPLEIELHIFSNWLFEKLSGKNVGRIFVNDLATAQISPSPEAILQVLEDGIRAPRHSS